MHVSVEPTDGNELDRLITALLNLTGVVHRVIEATEPPPGSDPVAVIGRAADRLNRVLSVQAEHFTDEELAFLTGFLAQATLIVAHDLGLGGYFTPG